MEEQFAVHRRLLERAERRAQLSFLDAVALEAKTDAKKAEQELANQRRVEQQFEALQKRQEFAEDAGRKRWLATSLQSIGAGPRGLVIGPDRAKPLAPDLAPELVWNESVWKEYPVLTPCV